MHWLRQVFRSRPPSDVIPHIVRIIAQPKTNWTYRGYNICTRLIVISVLNEFNVGGEVLLIQLALGSSPYHAGRQASHTFSSDFFSSAQTGFFSPDYSIFVLK